MLIHTYRDEEGNFKEEITKRESWRELFIFEAKWRFDERLQKLLGWQLKLYKGFPEYDRAVEVYWIWPLALWPLFVRSWFDLARFCYRKGWFRSLPEPGEVMHWFWPKYFLP